jgi:hypothetical protein
MSADFAANLGDGTEEYRADPAPADDVEALRQKILALPPSEFCGHFSVDFNGNCMTCQRDAERAVELAAARAEGAKAERERIAQAIESRKNPRPEYGTPGRLECASLDEAARIARTEPTHD